MAVSDQYVLQYLLQITVQHGSPLMWTETDSGYRAQHRDIEIQLDIVPSRTGDRVYLALELDRRRVWIAEPYDTGWLAKSYESEDAQRLAELFRELVRTVSRQCAAREDELRRNDRSARDVILNRLLFDADTGFQEAISRSGLTPHR
jgi:hypothetical protein